MTQGFQQQDSGLNGYFSKSVPPAQHGQKPDHRSAQPNRPARVVERRPGH